MAAADPSERYLLGCYGGVSGRVVPASEPGGEGAMAEEMAAVAALDELTELARRRPGMFVRRSRGPAADAAGRSLDDLTGEPMPGLSANSLAVEPWRGGRPLRLWIARRLFDYSHLKHEKGPDVRPWLLEGRELGARTRQ